VSRPQDYRNAGNLAMGVMDALNRTVYDPEEHVADGEQTPASQQVQKSAPAPSSERRRRVAITNRVERS